MQDHAGGVDSTRAPRSNAEVKRCLERCVAGVSGPWEPLAFTVGTAVLSSIVFCVGASPSAMPLLYLGLTCLGMPWRIFTFVQKKWTFFLIDFCYFANAAVIVYLLASRQAHFRNIERWQAAVYALSEGPLAAAVIVWKCSWVLGSLDHTTSVLIHLLPGLAMHSIRHLGANWSGSAAAAEDSAPLIDSPVAALTWLLVVPLLLYVAWQVLYWFVAQVLCREVIQARRFDTSYRCLSRREAKSNTFLHRLGRKGGVNWRLVIFGTTQLVFTLVTLMLAAATYFSPELAAAWQVVKFLVPLYYGAQYQVGKVPELAVRRGAHSLATQGLADGVFLELLDASGAYRSRTAPKAPAADEGPLMRPRGTSTTQDKGQ